MCGPAAPILAAASAAVSIAGTMVGAAGQAGNLRYEAGVDDINRAISNAKAKDSILNTNLEAQRQSRDQSQTAGRQVAAMAANGVDLGFGSAIDVQKDTAALGAEDMFQLYKSGNERTKGYEVNAFNYRTQAAAKRSQAGGALVGGIFGSVGTALGAASQISKMKGG